MPANKFIYLIKYNWLMGDYLNRIVRKNNLQVPLVGREIIAIKH